MLVRYPGNRTNQLSLHGLIKNQADRIPESLAIGAPGRQSISYGRLLEHVEHVARTLNNLGIGRNDRVAMVLPSGPEMALAVLAVASTASCVPLNPDYGWREFELYLSELRPKALIFEPQTNSPAAAVARRLSIPLIAFRAALKRSGETLDLSGASRPDRCQPGFAQEEDIALMLFTSGTTARPKLVPLTHQNLLASARTIAATLRLTEEDRCLSVMPLFHIHGFVGALLSSLAAGAGVICTRGFDREQFFPWFEEFRPTWYTAVPTIHQAVLSYVEANPDLPRSRSLRLIRSSSAPLAPKIKRDLEQVFNVPVLEAYGMTEASHQICSNPLPPGERKEGSVGLATGAEIAVVDGAGNPLSSGEVGEIVIRGANVLSKYAGNPTANRESFVNGWFRTGDRGYLDSDDYLFIVGRLKEIINRGGEKVSLAELDRVLLEQRHVAQAITFAVPHPTLGEDIAAAVVLKTGGAATEETLRRYVAARVAQFKVPQRILIVDEIPATATGKIQRSSLADAFAEQLTQPLSTPASALELTVAGIYAEVLGIEKVGNNDNFFLLGGDSLRGTQVLSRVRQAFEVNLPIATVFRKPTVAELSREIAQVLTQNGQV